MILFTYILPFIYIKWLTIKISNLLRIKVFSKVPGFNMHCLTSTMCATIHILFFSFLSGVYVHGLFLDGAGWDRRNCRLVEPPPKVLFTPLPVAHVYAVNATGTKDPRLYECPVYKKPRRTDLTYIFPLLLKTVQHPDHWILRGVALLCDTK